VAQALESGEQTLHVPDVVKEIRKDNDVERPAEIAEVVGVRRNEPKIRMSFAGDLQHRRREVDPDTFTRRERCKQVALSASQFEHAQPSRNEELIHVLEPRMVRAAGATASFPRLCDGIPVRRPRRPVTFSIDCAAIV